MSTGSRSQSSSGTSRGTSTSSGIGCPRGRTSRRRCVRWRYRRQQAGVSGRSGCPPWPTGSPRPSSGSYLEPEVEPVFHPDSYGYRPGRSALDAVATVPATVLEVRLGDRSRSSGRSSTRSTTTCCCKAVSKHTDLRWVLLYVKRWLKAPLQTGGRHRGRNEIGEPRRVRRSRRCWPTSSSTTRSIGGWPGSSRAVRFERYADDAVVHCATEAQAQPRAGGHRRADGAGRSGVASRQDAHRVLQGRRPPGLTRARAVQLLGVHVSSPTGEEQSTGSSS